MKIGIFLTCQHPPGSDMIAALEGHDARRARRATAAGMPSQPVSIISAKGCGRSSSCRFWRGSPPKRAR